MAITFNHNDQVYVKDGKLGIGTDSPSAKLHVSGGEIRVDAGQAVTLDTSNNMYLVGGSNQLRLYNGGNPVVNITTGGNVGIGTTSPSKKLHVNGSYKLGTNAYIQYDATYPYTINIENTASAGDIKLQSANGENKILLQPSTGGIDFYTNNSERMRITDGGNVGIGTTSPSSDLDVVGNTRLGPDSEHAFQVTDDSANNFLVLSSTQRTTASAARDIKFRSYGTDATDNVLVMDMSSGNVGIGTDSPSARLHIENNIVSEPLALFKTSSGDASIRVEGAGGESYLEIANTSTSGSTTDSWGIGMNDNTKLSFGWGTNSTLNKTDALLIDTSGNIQLPAYGAGLLTSDASGNITVDTTSYSTFSGDYDDLTNKPTIPVSGTDFDPVGTDNSTDVTLAGSYDYLTISGQEITLGQIDYDADITNLPTLGTAAATASTDYATAAQGTTADSALQPGDADLTPSWVPATDPNYLTSYTESGNITTTDDATNAFFAVPFVSTTAGSGKAVYKDANNFYYNPSTNNLQVGLLDLSDYGTAASPAIRWSGDGDTGIFSGGSNTNVIGFSTQGTEKMRLDASGNLGINVTNPLYKLDVGGTIHVRGNSGTFIRTIGSNNSDQTIIRISNGSQNDISDYGFSIKYMGTRSGNLNTLSIFSDNQNSAGQIEAITVAQNGIVGFTNASPTATVDIGGTLKASGAVTFSNYGAGLLQTDANGLISVDTSTYLTSYTETQTLDDVTTLGATTTNAITVGGITVGDSHFIGNETTYDNLAIISSSGENINLAAANGIYFNTNAVSASNVGNNRMYLSNAGNLGLNSTAPIGRIDVRGNYGRWRINGYGGMYFRNNSDTGYTRYIHPRSDGSLSFGRIADTDLSGTDPDKFAASSYDHFYLDSSGAAYFNGGINFPGVNGANFVVDTDGQRIVWEHQRNGTRKMTFYHEADADTFNFNFESGNKLQINGNRIVTVNELGTAASSAATDFVAVTGDTMTGKLTIDRSTTNDPALTLNSASSGWGSGMRFKNTTTTTGKEFGIYSSGTGYFQFTKESDSYGTIMRFTPNDDLELKGDNLLYTGSGNVGIGTTSPDRQLQVHEATSGTSTAKFTNSTTGEDGDTGFFVGINGSEQPILYGYNSTDMVIGTNGTERIRITSAGNVGIGTTAPSYKLDVAGDIYSSSRVVGDDGIGSRGVFKSWSVYSYSNGILIETDIDVSTANAWDNRMIMLTAYGMTYSSEPPITASFQCYNYNNGQSIISRKGISTDESLTMDVFHYNGKFYFFMEQTANYQTWHFELVTMGYHHKINSISNSAKPSTGVTNSYTITPSKWWHSDNDGSGSGLDADLLDGNHASDFVAVTGDTMTGNLLIERNTADPTLRLKGGDNSYDPIINLEGQGGDITVEGFQIWYDNSVGDVHLGTTYNNSAAAIRFHTRTGASKFTTNERMTILGDGNIGIGTTSPGAKLDVNGNISINAGQKIQLSGSNDSTHHIYHDSSTDYDKVNYSTGFQLEHYTSGVQFAVVGSSGNVGIGTTSPEAKLDVNGSIRVTGRTIPTSGKGLEIFYYSPSDLFYLEAYDYTNSVYKAIRYNGLSHQFITGNVGIGTTSPTSKLHVSGSVNFTETVVMSGFAPASTQLLTVGTDGTVGTAAPYTAGSGLNLSSGEFSIESDLRDGITRVGKDNDNYIAIDADNNNSIDFYISGVWVARMEADGDLHMKGDVIAFSDIFNP